MTNKHLQLSVVSDESATPSSKTDQPQRTLVYCTTIKPDRSPILGDILQNCPPIHRLAKSINEENMKQFFSTPVLYSPQELPIAFVRFPSPTTASAARVFRNGNHFYPILFDLFLAAFRADPDFFRGKKVVDIDSVIVSKNGNQMIPYIDGSELDDEQKIGFDLMVADYDRVWSEDTWFAFCTANPPRHPSAAKKLAPIFVEIDD